METKDLSKFEETCEKIIYAIGKEYFDNVDMSIRSGTVKKEEIVSLFESRSLDLKKKL